MEVFAPIFLTRELLGGRFEIEQLNLVHKIKILRAQPHTKTFSRIETQFK